MNPLLEPWTPPVDLLPFDKVHDEHWGPALEAALTEAGAAVQGIADHPEVPTFENTITALERADRRLNIISQAFALIANADSKPSRERLDLELAPKLAAYKYETTSNKALFKRIDALWEAHGSLDLSPEEARVPMLAHRRFVRAGARLEGVGAERMKEVQARLAVLMIQFAQNVLADERSWVMPLGEADLAGIPDFVVDAARAAGEERGAGGPVLTLSEAQLVPFLQFSPRRDLRRRAYEARAARGANGGSTDNRAIAAEMLNLREDQARLLGYPSFADWKLEAEMARTPQAVKDLLAAVWPSTRDAAQPTLRCLCACSERTVKTVA